MSEKIFVVTHKKIDKKINKKGYSYIQVNANNKDLNMEYRDNTGINIAEKNPNYCELTALYWIWKNYICSKNDILGLCHYRRFFSMYKFTNNIILDTNKIKRLMKKYDIILPRKFKFPVSTYEYYYNPGAGKEKDLIALREIIKEKKADYLETFDSFCKQNQGHYCNMMICSKEIFDDYCSWLFDLLFELERKTDLTNYTIQEARIYGYLSELLLNVYIMKNNLKVKELYVINTEIKLKDRIINKIKKKS